MIRILHPEIPNDDADNRLRPECIPTTAKLQAALDSQTSLASLHNDPHVLVCNDCRQRVRAARLILSAVSEPVAVVVPSHFTENLLGAIRADRRAQRRKRAILFVGGLAAAAAIVVAVWLGRTAEQPAPNSDPAPTEFVQKQPESQPLQPRHTPDAVAPEPKPMRFNDEVSKATQAFQNTSRPIVEPATSAPRMFASLAEGLMPPANMVPPDLEPTRRSLNELPDAARSGLAPVTGSAQKAFSRLIRDVSAISPGKSKS